MPKLLKSLGLSLFVLIACMVASTPAAQAKWLILLNGTSVLLLNLETKVGELEILVPWTGYGINCEFGLWKAHYSLNETHTGVKVVSSGPWKECGLLVFGEVCTVHSSGQKDGEILVSGTGGVSMEGSKVLESISSSEFTNIEFLGEECPLTEIDGRMSGSMTFEVANPTTNATSHGVTLVNYNLSVGEEEALLHNSSEGTVTGSMAEPSGATFAFHLVGL